VLLLYCAGWGCQPGRVRPRIRYCATPAGRVAYSTSGAGPALLCDSGWITDLRGQLELLSFGSFMERLAERFTVIRYDKPGCGLSDRDGIDLSFDGQVAAALAVADAVGAERFCLFGASQGGQLAGLLEVYYDTDIRALLPAIRARTAVLHREADRGTRFELGREVAALIPGATGDGAGLMGGCMTSGGSVYCSGPDLRCSEWEVLPWGSGREAMVRLASRPLAMRGPASGAR
jgi:hypothetical protein